MIDFFVGRWNELFGSGDTCAGDDGFISDNTLTPDEIRNAMDYSVSDLMYGSSISHINTGRL